MARPLPSASARLPLTKEGDLFPVPVLSLGLTGHSPCSPFSWEKVEAGGGGGGGGCWGALTTRELLEEARSDTQLGS